MTQGQTVNPDQIIWIMLNSNSLVTPHKDYPGQDFAKLKYDCTQLLNWSGQSHLDTRTDKSSTWLHPTAFRYWIRNSGSPVSKCSELLASHRGGLRSEGYLYSYSIRVNLDSRNSSGVGHVQYKCTFTSHLYAIPMSPHSLVKRTTTLYGIQWPMLDKHYHP